MIPRALETRLRDALADTPVVFLQGPRQAGKSTLAKALTGPGKPFERYVTLDDATALSAARSDPEGYLAGFPGPVVLDEVQLAPGLFRAVKAAVDRDRRPGRYLMTGSADALLFPGIAEALAGRVEVLTLWPLSQAEQEGRSPRFLSRLLSEVSPPSPSPSAGDPGLTARIARGGFPEAVGRAKPDRRAAWFDSYLSTLLQRDIRAVADVAGLSGMPRLLALVAARSPGLVNFAEMSRSLALPQTTLKRYVALLEAAMVVRFLPAWAVDPGRRLVKSPRILVADTGLASRLLGADEERIAADPILFGNLLQVFATLEVVREAASVAGGVRLHHFRTATGREVDLVVEDGRGRVVGIEVKAAASAGPADFAGLRALAELCGPRFHRGVVLHRGRETVPFGRNLFAMPVESLWD